MMIPAKKEELPVETKIFSKAYLFYLKCQNPVTDEDWNEIMEEAKALEKEFQGNQLIINMLITLIEDIERKYKKRTSH